jgi:hypothetical protein
MFEIPPTKEPAVEVEENNVQIASNQKDAPLRIPIYQEIKSRINKNQIMTILNF